MTQREEERERGRQKINNSTKFRFLFCSSGSIRLRLLYLPKAVFRGLIHLSIYYPYTTFLFFSLIGAEWVSATKFSR